MKARAIVVLFLRFLTLVFTVTATVMFLLPFDTHPTKDDGVKGQDSSTTLTVSTPKLFCNLKKQWSEGELWKEYFRENNTKIDDVSKKLRSRLNCLKKLEEIANNGTSVSSASKNDCMCLNTSYLIIITACTGCIALQYLLTALVGCCKPIDNEVNLSKCQAGSLCAITFVNFLVLFLCVLMLIRLLFISWPFDYKQKGKKGHFYSIPLTWYIGFAFCCAASAVCLVESFTYLCFIDRKSSAPPPQKEKSTKSSDSQQGKPTTSSHHTKRPHMDKK